MSRLRDRINQQDAVAFTHSGKFHADDVFASALMLYLNPKIQVIRGNKVPDDFQGIVYDIGRGEYDHHQRDSKVRENGVPFAAFGLVWEELGVEILGEELALRFDEEFIQPLDMNDNTGEKNELASLIGDFNPSWDVEGGTDEAFSRAVSFAGMVLENKFAKYRGNERADRQVEEYLGKQQDEQRGKQQVNALKDKILVMPKFVPYQKKLSGTDIEFVIFPSNRGGYNVQPLKKEGSMNYKCSFPENWLGLENEELKAATGLKSAVFCHKGGFILSMGKLEDAVNACRISQKNYVMTPVIINLTEGEQTKLHSEQTQQAGQWTELQAEQKIKQQAGQWTEEQTEQRTELQAEQQVTTTTVMESELQNQFRCIPGMEQAIIKDVAFPEFPTLAINGIYGEVALEQPEWKQLHKDAIKKVLADKPELVIVNGNILMAYPLIHFLRKKRIPVVTPVTRNGKMILVRIPSGS